MPLKRYYTKCDNCGKKIYLGDPIFYFDGYCGTYCSGECYAEQYASTNKLTLQHVDNCNCELHQEIIDKVMVEKVVSDEIIVGEDLEELFKEMSKRDMETKGE